MERTFRNSQAVCMQQRGCFAACKVLLLCCHPALLCWTKAPWSFAVNHWGYFIYLTWMPTYFSQVLGEWLHGQHMLGRCSNVSGCAMLSVHRSCMHAHPDLCCGLRIVLLPCACLLLAGMDLRASSLMSFVPWVVMAIGSSAAGLLADGLVARGVPVLRVRKRIQTVAFLGPVVALMVLSSPGISPPLALLCMTAALGITSLG